MNRKIIKKALDDARQCVKKGFDKRLGAWIVTVEGPSWNREIRTNWIDVHGIFRGCLAAEAVRLLRPGYEFEDAFAAVVAALREFSFSMEVSFWLRMTAPLVKRATEILDSSTTIDPTAVSTGD